MKNLKSKTYLRSCQTRLLILIIVTMTISASSAISQFQASPANWLYPNGNSEGTHYVERKSMDQEIDSFIVKWSSPSISGDVKPLVGNIINNDKLFSNFAFAPNEIAAVVGGTFVIIDAQGKTHSTTNSKPFVKGFSVLFDSTQSQLNPQNGMPVIMGVETIEFENVRDSLAYAYIAGYNEYADTVAIIQKVAVDLRPYKLNVFGSVKPVFGRKSGSDILLYATVNMSQPQAPNSNPATAPFFRGFTQFDIDYLDHNYPLPDIGDNLGARIELGPEVSFAQPSIGTMGGSKTQILLPFYSSPSLDVSIDNMNVNNGPSYADGVFLLGYDISGIKPINNIGLTELIDPVIPTSATRPQIRPMIVQLTDGYSGRSGSYILVAEEYRGVDGSIGTARLHLYDSTGLSITMPGGGSTQPPYSGGENHLWSIAVGNVDGNGANAWLPYYPNNPGNEIIVTQSTRDFAVPASTLSILRYYGDYIDKPTPPNSFLYPFDTLATQRINGWVAAVNDLDNLPDGKDEILLVDGSKLRIMKMKNYRDYELRGGKPFDTLFTFEFSQQTISHVAVADLEGDGKNDIIVTTFDSLYIIGSEILNVIEILDPSVQQTPPFSFCYGDTVFVRWENIFQGHDEINIKFQPTSGLPGDTAIVIEMHYSNFGDLMEYPFIVDETVMGNEGYFIIESSSRPSKIYDHSATIRFSRPQVAVDIPENIPYRSGDDINFTGFVTCVDSIEIQVTYENSTQAEWETFETLPVMPDGSFSVSTEMPCAPIFNCLDFDDGGFAFFRALGFKSGFTDTTQTVPLSIAPAIFPVRFDTCPTACPTIEFEWDMMGIDLPCDTVVVSIYEPSSGTYSLVDEVEATGELFVWNVPTNMPDSLQLRFCCKNSCVRRDTIIRSYKPSFIDIVAPNPFNPLRDEVEVIYHVPKSTNVTMKIIDQANRVVAQPVKGLHRVPGIAYCERWNGLRHDGSPVDNGMYYILLEFSSGTRQVHPVFVKK